MPRLIFKCPYIKGGTSSATAHLENYVKYMATRNGVERIDPGRSEWPATSKQKKMVEQILRDFPLSRGMFEYEDYAAEPTRTNASEFITRALEDNYNQIAKKDNYLKYIATRPRAQRVGSHGLFTGEEDQLVLAQVAEAVAAHPGNVWLPIISLRREDAARLGYDKAEEWKALLSEYAMEMAEAMKIPWEDFRWYAAFHDEAHHPHIHMVCYSADPSKGFLTTQGIAQIKSGLAKEIFRQELTELYQQQTQSRDTLNEDARSMLEQLIEQMWSGAVVNHRMEKLMEHLAERLRHTGGRKQYGYLKAPLKAVVDEIVDELAKEPCVAAAYALWYELREDVLRTYKDDLPPRLPLSQQKAFKRIKNIVIEEAVTLGARQQVFHPDDQQDRVPVEDQEEAPLPEAPQPDNDWNDFSESPPDDVPDKTVSAPAKAQMNWSDEYRLARRCLFGGKDQPQDLEQAFTLFQQEAQKGNALAMHDLGRMLADGLGRKIDMQAAHVWYSKALAAFYAVERQKKKRYAEYRIGKLYAAGLGCEQDYLFNALGMLDYRCYPEDWTYERLGPDGMTAFIFWGHDRYGSYDTTFMFERYVELDERWLFDLAKDPEGRKPTVTWQTYNRGGVLYGSYDEMFISLLPRKVENPELKRILRDYFRIRSEKVKVEESITVYKDATERFGD